MLAHIQKVLYYRGPKTVYRVYSNCNNIMAQVSLYVNLGSSAEEIRQTDLNKMRQGAPRSTFLPVKLCRV